MTKAKSTSKSKAKTDKEQEVEQVASPASALSKQCACGRTIPVSMTMCCAACTGAEDQAFPGRISEHQTLCDQLNLLHILIAEK